MQGEVFLKAIMQNLVKRVNIIDPPSTSSEREQCSILQHIMTTINDFITFCF